MAMACDGTETRVEQKRPERSILSLARNAGERVVIVAPSGERLFVDVVRIQHGQVKLGFHAPRSYAVNRAEIQERIDAERAAGKS